MTSPTRGRIDPLVPPGDAPRTTVAADWGRPRNLRQTAREHWVFLTVLVTGCTLRVVTQLAYRPALLYIDSFRYLANQGPLDPNQSEPIGYNLFLLRPVLLFGTLADVAARQHVLGVAMGVAIYLVLVRRGVPMWIAAVAAAPVLLDAYQLQIEQNVMSEALFEAFIVGAIVLLLWNRRPRYTTLAFGGALFGLAATTRVVAVALVIPAVAFAAASGTGIAPRCKRASVMLVAFLVPVLLYVGYFTATTGRVGLNSGDASLLYGRAAVVVEQCQELAMPRYERPLCPAEPLEKRLGVDRYAHDNPVVNSLVLPHGITRNDAERDFARRVIASQPLDVAHAVVTDFTKVFAWGRTTSPGDVSLKRWQFQDKYPRFASSPRFKNDAVATARQYGGGDPTVSEPLAEFLRAYQLTVGFMPGPFVALAFLLGILGSLGAGRARRSGLRAATALPTLCGLILLLGAAVFEFSWRYQLPALPLAPMGAALGLTAVAGLARVTSEPK